LTYRLTPCILLRLEDLGVVMAKGHRVTVKLKSTKSPYMYHVRKNKQNTTERLELKKYDPVVRKHVIFKEVR